MIDPLRALCRTAAADLMARDSAHDLAHLDRVWASCDQIREAEGGDRRVLVAAAYLHDLVNLPKDAPDRAQASRLAARKAVPVLESAGFDAAEMAATTHAIEAHSFSAGIAPQTPEARILRDADRLDAIGAVGLARTFAVAGQLGRTLYDPEDPFARQRAPDDTRFAIDHFPLKLLRLPAGMTTATGKRIAKKRCAVMLDFLDELAQEIGHPQPDHWRKEIANA